MRKRLALTVSTACMLMMATARAEGDVNDGAPCARDTGPASVGMPTTERIFGWVEQLTAMGPRRTGTPAGAKAAAYMKCQFEALGLEDVHYESAPSWNWQARKWSLHVNGQPIDSFPVAFSFIKPDRPSVFATPPGGLQRQLVDIGSGTPAELAGKDVKGKIVVFDLRFPIGVNELYRQHAEFIHDPDAQTNPAPRGTVGNPYQSNFVEVANALMKAGAVGFVGVLADYFDSNKYHNEFYRRAQVTIPGLWVTRRDGATLREAARAAREPMAKLVLEGQRRTAMALSVVGALPGKSRDTLLVTSHHDSVSDGAVEDATGAAAVLAQAQYFASKPLDQREKTLLFTTMDSHFTGYQAHHAFAQKYILSRSTPYNVVGDVTLEHIGRLGVTVDGELVVTDHPEERIVFANISAPLRTVLKNAIVKNNLRRTGILASGVLCGPGKPGIPTDAFSCAAGVPTASFVSGPAYLYDEADTLDKVAKEELLPVTRAFAELLEAMDKTPSSQLKQ